MDPIPIIQEKKEFVLSNKNVYNEVFPDDGYDAMQSVEIKNEIPSDESQIQRIKNYDLYDLNNQRIEPDENYDAMNTVELRINGIRINKIGYWTGEGSSVSDTHFERKEVFISDLEVIEPRPHWYWKYNAKQYWYHILIGNTFYSTIDPEPYDPPRLIHHKIPSFGILYAGQGPIDYKTHRKYQRLQFKCKVPSISSFWQKFLGVQFMSGDKVVMEFVPWGFEMVNIDVENPTHPIEIAKGVKTTTDTLAVRPPFWIESRVVTEDEDFIINPEEYGFEMVQVQEINRE